MFRTGQQRQSKKHRQAVPLVDRTQMAIVKADDTFCHGKPNAEAVFFRTLGPIKAFEYMRQILLRNAAAVIKNFQEHHAATLLYRDLYRRTGRRIVQSVDKHVDKRLLKPFAVTAEHQPVLYVYGKATLRLRPGRHGAVGFFASSVFSIIYSMALQARPEKANQISGLMITAVAGGGVVTPVIGFAIGTVGVIGGVFVTLACVCYLTYCAFGVKTAKA